MSGMTRQQDADFKIRVEDDNGCHARLGVFSRSRGQHTWQKSGVLVVDSAHRVAALDGAAVAGWEVERYPVPSGGGS